MSTSQKESYHVEFWQEKIGVDIINTSMLTIACDNQRHAISVEKAFHAIGWIARAVMIKSKEEKTYL
jgi:hypothetical protein